MNKRNFGVAAVIVSAVCFGFVPMFMQYLKSMGRHDLERSLLQVLFIAAAYILLFKNKESASFHNKETVCKSMPHNDSRLRRDFSFAFLLV